MKRFVTSPKVSAEVHGGSFLWDSYRLTLTISDKDEVIYEKEPISPKPSSSQILTGHVIRRGSYSWLEIHLRHDPSSKKLVLYALEVDDQLICAVYSEFNQSSSSELFYKDVSSAQA
ncbi:MAG TPA: hypothetical protein VN693_03685 [Rhodanobacteraceae bacterium]|nr:hypothetical protein [Rhodanobacteraceae bacterium]